MYRDPVGLTIHRKRAWTALGAHLQLHRLLEYGWQRGGHSRKCNGCSTLAVDQQYAKQSHRELQQRELTQTREEIVSPTLAAMAL